VVRARRAPYLPVGWFWYLGSLVPVIGIVQVGSQAHADRYTYLPLIGLFIVMVWGSYAVIGRRVFLAVAAVVVTSFAVVSSHQLQYWRDGVSMWQRAVDVVPNNYRAHAALGILLRSKPDRRAEAMSHLTEAIRLRSDLAPAHSALADLLFEQGRMKEAIEHLARVVELNPMSASARTRLGQALAADGQLAAAIEAFRGALAIDPQDARARAALEALIKR